MRQPLAEVYGSPICNSSHETSRCRKLRLCPFNNKIPNCTKERPGNPLGVCSINGENNDIAIICPIRFRENWIIAENAADFFFPKGTLWTSLTDIPLLDKKGNSVGNIDVVVISYDREGKIKDFGPMNVHATYVQGNLRRPFENYVKNPEDYQKQNYEGQNYPQPDYMSSWHKRLTPHLIFKGGIFYTWQKKMSMAVHKSFMKFLPELTLVEKEYAEIAWFIYDLIPNPITNLLTLTHIATHYTLFEPVISKFTHPEPGPLEDFVALLQDRLDTTQENEDNPPDAPTLNDLYKGPR